MIYALTIEAMPAVVATVKPGRNPSNITVIIAGKNIMVTLTMGSGIVPIGVNVIIIVMAIMRLVTVIVLIMDLFIVLLFDIEKPLP